MLVTIYKDEKKDYLIHFSKNANLINKPIDQSFYPFLTNKRIKNRC